MQVGVVSDTHDNLDVAQAAVDRFQGAGVDVVVHCGDIVSPFTARVFDVDDFDFYAVRGNNDGEWALQGLVEDFGAYLGEMGELELAGAHVAVYHGTSEAVVGALVDSGTYDYVLRGHTHEQVHEKRNGTVHLNPGGIPIDPAGAQPVGMSQWSDTGSGESLRGPAETAIHQCMGLEAGESCCVVTDDKREPIGEALHAVAYEVTDEAAVVCYPPGGQHGEEPPEPVAAAMAGADVVLAPTTKSLSHTAARTDANEAGARVATLPGITETVFRTGLNADYEGIAAECQRVYDAVADAEELRVTSPQGTDVTVRPGDREWRQDTGVVHEAGAMSNLPAGETFVSPESADGRVVVDGTMMPHGRLDPDETVTFTVADGQVTDIEDEGLRESVETAATEAGDAAYNFAEMGIGTNLAVTDLVGSVLLDEKAAGTVHLAVGDDHGIGGDTRAPIHQDGVLTDPTVYADGEELDLPG